MENTKFLQVIGSTDADKYEAIEQALQNYKNVNSRNHTQEEINNAYETWNMARLDC